MGVGRRVQEGGMTRAIIPCARCGGQPKLEIKQQKPCSISSDGRWFRLVCCRGGGRFFLTPGRALRAWNGAQIGWSSCKRAAKQTAG